MIRDIETGGQAPADTLDLCFFLICLETMQHNILRRDAADILYLSSMNSTLIPF